MFDYQPHLTGELVAMRPLAASDFEALFALAADPEVWALHPQVDRWREPVFRAFFDEGLASGGALVALNRETGEIIGSSRYSAQFVEPGEIEIGWTFLGRPWWGGAWNAGMKRLMLAHAFRFVDQVVFRVGETNLRSRRALEKIGAKLTDRTQAIATASGPAVHLYYAIARTLPLIEMDP